MNVKSRIRTRCFVCGEPIHFDKPPNIGDIVNCAYCDEAMEVIGLNPITIDWPFDAESFLEDDYLEEDY
ncbi:MAG: hypothetical protein ACK2TU_00655 [Anaerolineales bacterium]|jgi:hypothetical protein